MPRQGACNGRARMWQHVATVSAESSAVLPSSFIVGVLGLLPRTAIIGTDSGWRRPRTRERHCETRDAAGQVVFGRSLRLSRERSPGSFIVGVLGLLPRTAIIGTDSGWRRPRTRERHCET